MKVEAFGSGEPVGVDGDLPILAFQRLDQQGRRWAVFGVYQLCGWWIFWAESTRRCGYLGRPMR